LAIDLDSLYLQAGWIRGEGGNGYLGRRWAGDLGDTGAPYGYPAASVSPEQPTHCAGIVRPPDGAAAVHVWLLNFRSEGDVFFEDILLLSID